MTKQQSTRLSMVVDGLDVRGDGFAALIEYVHTWEGVENNVQTAPFESLLQKPETHRGHLFLVEGEIEQIDSLSNPWNGVSEWFIRTHSGELFVIYVSGETHASIGTSISSIACFYKTMSMEGRDQQHRLYPTFVTSSVAVKTGTFEKFFTTSMLILVLVMGLTVVLLQRYNAKKRQRTLQPVRIKSQEVIDAVNDAHQDLPSRPAEALADLYHNQDQCNCEESNQGTE